jgi:NAD(P)-dependent dehydrogenase (short-subunit alcohol dehydrogenase family)
MAAAENEAANDRPGADLHGRTAIVTGASRGIGFAVAQQLAAAGANVVLTARKQESAEDAAARITGGGQAVGIAAHVTDDDAARSCLDDTMDRFGSVDILVNNAGTNPAYGPLVDQDHARFAKTIDINVWAPVLWTSLAVEAWMRDNGGSVVNVSSIGGLVHEPGIGVYNASKSALIYLTRQLALELSPKIRVNCVCPGVVQARLSEALWKGHEDELAARTALGRIGTIDDVGSAVAFLASDAAAWMTGEAMAIDGGQSLGDPEPFRRGVPADA